MSSKFNSKKEIEINISDRIANVFLVLGFLILLVASVNAVVPNPGHALSDIENACGSSGTGCDFLSNYYTSSQVDSKCSTASAPNAPGIITATTDRDLTWSDNSNDEDQFEIQRKQGSGSFSDLVALSANTVSYFDSSAPTDVSIEYRIRACKSGSCSAYAGSNSVIYTEA